MLQRAASNAYSWWWASHIRTKQSKWLEQNLQDMGEKVECMLKLIEEDGDSFAKRAEMYYKKRPELINFVEESYRAYRALAERYDHISTELQNANTTIASVFPEQVQFAMDEEDEDGTPRFQKKSPEASKLNIPKVPKPPSRDLKGLLTMATKNLRLKKASKSAAASSTIAKSGLSKPEAVEEIDELQKGILALQTEKEFVKSSYEHDLAKYWEIEKKITEMQERICSLQDEFSVSAVIEDDEARTLMAAAALKSCQETLGELQKKQEKSVEEARVEHQRIKGAREKLESFENEFLPDRVDGEKENDKDESVDAGEKFRNLEQDVDSMTKERRELELLREKIKEHFDVGSNMSLTVTEMAEKIDELVNKVINLSTAVSSQTALIKRLRTETDEIQAQIRSLEDDKVTMVDGTDNLRNKLRKMEKKLHCIHDLNQDVEVQNINLQTHFTEAHCNLDHLSEKLHSIKPDEELEVTGSLQGKDGSLAEAKSQKEFEEQEKTMGSGANVEKLHGMEPDEKLEAAAASSQKHIKDQGDALNPGDDFEKAGDVQTEARDDIKEPDLSTSVQNQTDEKLEAATSSQNDEGSQVEVQSQKEIEDQGDALNPGDGFEKAGAVQTEAGENIKEHDPSTCVKNHGGDENVGQFQANSDPENLLKLQDDVDKQDSNQTVDNLLNIEPQEKGIEQEDEPNWQQLFLNGLDDRQKILLTEYTTTLRNYKSVKKQLSEVEKKNQGSLLEIKAQLRAQKSVNDKKDAEIRSLYQKLSLLQTTLDENKDLKEFKDSNQQPASNLLDEQDVEPKARTKESTATETPTEEKEDDDVEVTPIDQPQSISTIEDKFRMNIDELLEENLNFWLRFSTSFHQIQKFQTGVEDLQSEISKLKEKKVKPEKEGSTTTEKSLKSDARPIYKHLREIQTELTVWLEQSALLKDELQCRFSSLCDIQEEITRASEDEEIKFTSYQAAKFQGEILNMKQENNKVADELQAGLDHVTGLQLEIEKTLANLNEDFGISGSKRQNNFQLRHSTSRSRVPLRSFIFGVKPKKQKPSFFACMSPVLHRKYNHLRTGSPM